ncbi:MAG: adenylyl-sulfate reductase [Gammaproteobacteria bacterium]|nr:adenylyl-sulfate reductase [Gammaproteobacteria bacterium]MDH5345603.1 adenylyl-sulfate reductase [Gammaproteobacteria bacterium]
MFTVNPFAELSAFMSPSVMQAYVIVMVVLVAVGTIYDVLHKKSATYFRQNMRRSKAAGTKVGGGEMISLALRTAVVDVAASGEFCNQRRRIAHLLTMYGFVLFAITTVVMVFRYMEPGASTPAILPQLWWAGAAMVCVGGYWFWFFIRADVAAEGNSPFRIMRADLFVLSLLGSATFALVWAYMQFSGNAWTMIAFWLHVIFTTVLFGSVPWSKFAHMFFKPAAAFEKRLSAANGTRSNLPPPVDKPESFGKVDLQPRNY